MTTPTADGIRAAIAARAERRAKQGLPEDLDAATAHRLAAAWTAGGLDKTENVKEAG